MNTTILVGVDGSIPALNAVRWAADEAARRNLRLELVHAYTIPPLAATSYRTEALEWARHCLRDAVTAVHDVEPELEPTVELEIRPVIDFLAEKSKSASMIVIGSRGLGGFAGLLLGSTAVGLAARSQCPLVVIRGTTVDALPTNNGPVVVGIDGSPMSEAAIAFAYEEASFRQVDLVAVHTWSDVPLEWGGVVPFPELDWLTTQDEEDSLLAERLAGWGEKYPDVIVRRVVQYDQPALRLLREAEDAQLVVVGSRGRGGFTGLLLGSTSQAVLHHAPCPVAIVRSAAAEQ